MNGYTLILVSIFCCIQMGHVFFMQQSFDTHSPHLEGGLPFLDLFCTNKVCYLSTLSQKPFKHKPRGGDQKEVPSLRGVEWVHGLFLFPLV